MLGVTLELDVNVEKLDEFIRLMQQVMPETRAYDGCGKFDVWVDQDNKGRMLLNELWASREHHQNYLAWRTETGMMEQLTSYLNQAPAVSYYTIVEP